MEASLERLAPEYKSAFNRCAIREEFSDSIQDAADQLVSLRHHYDNVEKSTSVPWWFVGILHCQEWQFQAPARFEREVAEVLKRKGYHQAKTRTLAAYLWGFDLWNGFRDGAGSESSWVWGGTNIAKDRTQSLGAAAILTQLKEQGLIEELRSRPTPKTSASSSGKPKSASASPSDTSETASDGTKKLSVRYFTQRDNAGQAHRTCNTASCWMGAVYMHPELWEKCNKDKNGDLNYYLPVVEQYGDTTDHTAQTRALSALGVKSEWHTTLTTADVKKEIDQQRPVVLGVLHKGHSSCPGGGGHMILAVGYDDKGLIIHDPYGEMDLVNGNYPGSTDGAYVHYSYKNLQPRFEVDGPGTGWGRLYK